MAISLNSTFSDLDYFDKAAYVAPYWLYQSGFGYNIIPFGATALMASSLVLISSYATICQPKSAKDPIDGKGSKLWDPTDRDGSELYITSPFDVINLNGNLLDLKRVISIPFLGASSLYGFNILLQKMDISKSAILSYTSLFLQVPFCYLSLSFLLGSLARQVAFKLGLKGNSGFFFNRYRLTLSHEDKLPLGSLEKFDLEMMEMSKKEFKRFKKFMLEENNCKVIKPTKVETKKQISSLIWDSRVYIAAPITLAFSVIYYLHNPALNANYDIPRTNWIINNMAAASLAISSASLMKVGSFKVAMALLGALFVYDVYFVFASDVMLKVATAIDVPAKLVFPGPPTSSISLSSIEMFSVRELTGSFSILGLGDIVVPTCFVSLCLRYDYYKFYAQNNLPFHKLRCIGVPKYFLVSMTSYLLGLLMTMYVNFYTGKGQPALFYIVPSLLTGVFGAARFCDDLSDMWNYSEYLKPFSENNSVEGETTSKSSEVSKNETIYEFDGLDEEDDDTYIIDELTEEDDDMCDDDLYDDEDLGNEIDFLLKDQ